MTIKFGTDGWRAVISDGFTYGNVRIVAQAIADYVNDLPGGGKTVVIGYDTRFMSDHYALECAAVLAANGLRVLLADGVTPTPALSFAVKKRQAAGGIMITASHNPYQYNGIKYKADYAGSALPEIIAGIEQRLGQNAVKLMPLQEAKALAKMEYFAAEADYLEHLRTLVDLEKIAGAGLRVVVDPMHGAGAGVIKRLLAGAGMDVNETRGERNPLFGGVNPEPIRPNLQALVDTVTAEKADAGFATDGDADRVGAVDANGEFINSHVIYALLFRYLVSVRKWTGGVVKTFSTSQMIDKLAYKFNIPVFETPIGFKYICELFLKEDILLGGEESGGIGFKHHIPERDGILSSLLLMEMMAEYGRPLHEIIDDLMREVGYHYYDRMDLHLTAETKEKALKLLAEMKPRTFAGTGVADILDLDGVKLMLRDGSWILFRASGTEPVIRIYAEAGSRDLVGLLLKTGRSLIEQ